MEECIFCSGELEKYFIKKFEYWTVYLYENQYHLGRVYIVLNRHGPESTIELTKLEWDEFKDVIDRVTKSLMSLYKYDLIQYLVSQMRDRNHFHMYLIPRYIDARVAYNEEFKDELWGKPPFPVLKREFDEKVLMKIKEDIRKEL